MARCSECGFLAVRNKETRGLEEIEFESRQSGDIKTGRYHYIPVCFAMAANFGKELEELMKFPENAKRQNEMGEVIWPKWENLVQLTFNNERECKPFTKWQQGFTPKEHREMIDWERERRWHSIELIIFVVITLIAGVGGAIIGALIARGTI